MADVIRQSNDSLGGNEMTTGNEKGLRIQEIKKKTAQERVR